MTLYNHIYVKPSSYNIQENKKVNNIMPVIFIVFYTTSHALVYTMTVK